MDKKRFKKIYVEITNSCNLKCSFCPEGKRAKEFITLENFKHIINEIKSYTNLIALHVKGEPLLHPNLKEILDVCKENNILVNITTNATLLEKNLDILINNSEYHFIYKGIKFANLRIIKDRKIFSHRDKDVLDLRQIELFENYYGHIEQEKIFKARIIQEQKRRGLISEEFSTPSISINISQKTNINKKKLPRWLGKIICLFIPKAKNRKRFREKYVMKRS